MYAKEARQQTTKGAFLAICDSSNILSPPDSYQLKRKVKPLLVVDFEGTDGQERGKVQNFERQLSLFALSVADTLIINMWTNEVGRFNAANLSLLTTVFEVNLQLFKPSTNLDQRKSTLLFVMRDFDGNDITKNAATIRTSINNIWNEIHKPKGLEGCKVDHLFYLQFFGFPHYKFQKNEFISCVNDFRQLFVNVEGYNTNTPMTPLSDSVIKGNTTELVFRSPLTTRGIPLESLPQYMSDCWGAIRKSECLNIPPDREMFSHLRCRELTDDKVSTYRRVLKEYTTRMVSHKELVPDLQAIIGEQYQQLLKEYITETEICIPSIVETLKVRLCEEMDKYYESAIKAEIKLIVDDVFCNMDADICTLVDTTIRDIIWCNDKILNTADLPLDMVSDSSYVGAHELDVSGPEVNVIVTHFWERLANSVALMCEAATDREKAGELLGRWSDIIMRDSTLREMVLSQLTVAVTLCIRKRLMAMTNDISTSMHNTFEYVLNHNVDGSIRSFTSTDELQRQYRPARFAGLVLAACLIYYRLKVTTGTCPMCDDISTEKIKSDSGKLGEDKTLDNKNLIFKTVNIIRSACVYFEDNEDEKYFYLSLGTAHVSPDMTMNTNYGSFLTDADDTCGLVRYPTPYIIPYSPICVNNRVMNIAEIGCSPKNNGVVEGKILITEDALRRSLDVYFHDIKSMFHYQLKNVQGSKSYIFWWPWWMRKGSGFAKSFFFLLLSSLPGMKWIQKIIHICADIFKRSTQGSNNK